MEQVTEFFQKLFQTEDWPPRWICGEWTEFHGWLYIISDLLIWLSYFAIPFFLLAFVLKKDNIPLPRVFWLFSAFILMCGLSHLMDAIIFWWPAYRLSALVRLITALVSMATVLALLDFFPQALKLKTSAEFEKELQHRTQVEQELRDAQTRLKARNEQLMTKNEEMQQFASIVSHDLKAPLQSFTSIVDLLKKKEFAQDEEVGEYFQYLDESTVRMRGLITDLLDFARLGTKPQLASVDCNKLMDEVETDLKNLIIEKKAKISYDRLPQIEGYRTELRLLFQNLISNALKFNKENEPPLVEIQAEEREEDWLFEVRDYGVGIRQNDQKKIFLIFQRLHEGESHEGSGIGLAHCKKIIEIHQGHIWVESKFGEGSSFFFTISKNLVGQPHANQLS